MAEITDLLGKASVDDDYAIATTVKVTRAPGATVLEAYDVSKFADDTPVFFITYKKTTNPTTGAVSVTGLVSWKGLVNVGANTITNLTLAPGYTDEGNDEGDFIECIPTSFWENSLINGLLNSLNLDGTPKPVALNPIGVVSPFAGAAAPDGWLICNGAAVSRDTYEDLFDVIGTTYGAGDGATTFNLPDLRSRSPIGVGTGTYSFTFASTDVNTANDQITIAANPELVTGRKIQLTTTGALPTGLALATDYYVIVVDSTHIKLASSLANAVAGTAIDITGAGSGTNTATGTLSARALGDHGGEESHANTIAEMPSHDHDIYAQIAGSGQTRTAGTRYVNSNFNTQDSNDTTSTGASGKHNNMQPFLALNYIIKT